MPEVSTPAGAAGSIDEIYQAIKQRILSEPAVLRVLAQKPEIRVEIERPTIEAKPDSIQGRLAQMIAEGFFDKPVSGGDVQRHWARSAITVSPGTLYPALKSLAQLGFLTIEQGRDSQSRVRDEYRAVPGMKVNIIER